MASLNLGQALASGGLKVNSYGSNTYAGPVAPGTSAAAFRLTGQSYSPPKPQVLGASTQQGASASSASQSIPSNNSQPQYDALKSQQDAANAQLEADYNQAMGVADSAEQGLKGQAGTATAQIGNDAASVQTELTKSQGTQEQGVNTSLSTAEKQGTSALQQARDLFRQTQQSNNAQLSALGISSSSVTEALAERLGVETARRIAGVTGSLDEVRQNATNELGRIKGYFSDKSAQLAENVRIQKDQIQQSLVQGLNQINSARQKAASDKASARANLLSQTQSAIAQLTQQQQQFQQSLDTWAAQKSAALTPITQDPNYVQNLLAQTQNIQQSFDPSQFVATPSFNVDKTGQYTGQISLQKPKDPNDPNAGSPNSNPDIRALRSQLGL